MADENKENSDSNENRSDSNYVQKATSVLEIIANKISRKAAVVAMGMVLIYLLAATPNVVEVLFFIVPIAGLAVFFTVMQFRIDMKDIRQTREDRASQSAKRAKEDELKIEEELKRSMDDGKD